MSDYTDPVVRRKPGDPWLYVCPRRADGWQTHHIAFKTAEDVSRAGFVIGAWQTDEHGDYAAVTLGG